jgi:hypothetical protein
VIPGTTDDLITELQKRVRQRRAAGDYPIGLEAQLQEEFKNVLETTHRSHRSINQLQTRMILVRESVMQIQGVGGVKSRLPGGSLFHKVIRRLIRRHVSQLAKETRNSLERIESVLEEFETLIKEQQSNDKRLLNQTLSGVLDKLAVVDTLSEMVVELESRVYQDGDEKKN